MGTGVIQPTSEVLPLLVLAAGVSEVGLGGDVYGEIMSEINACERSANERLGTDWNRSRARALGCASACCR